MFRTISLSLIALAFAYLASSPSSLTAQTVSQSETSPEDRWATLPTDRAIRGNRGVDSLVYPSAPTTAFQDAETVEPDLCLDGKPPFDVKKLLRPRGDVFAEWEPEADGIAISSFEVSGEMPVYPVFGPPPPFIRAGYSFTQINAPVELDLPENLHDISLGLAWMRPISERWIARFTLEGAFASDMENTSSDAWQVRAGAFALFRPNEQWSWAFGALATGRDDLPIIPALGVILEPSRDLRIDLMMPRPRISLLVAESKTLQHWAYIGAGISGGTWAYDRIGGSDERLSYREFRAVIGCESMPPRAPGTFRSSGTKLNAEVGYVFGREFEFDGVSDDIPVDDTLLLRSGVSF